ncbi:tyrosine-type recombinase/integrase [Bacillus sp. NRRL B-14911]|uniref:tyrosine-type recombinase/integrase n=1 Tax=Bacillus sp. NRRL B-14911 TaxID=313627 RepID=UPI001E477B8F|nr:tyrosine-type recombinase/integrase [Bacillus sp. NRRL B-14911]
MREVAFRNMDLQIKEWKKKIDNQSVIPILQDKLDLAEKNNEGLYSNFNDVEMIQWFLYRKQHLNHKHDKSSRTIKEYKLEINQFVEQLLKYSLEINIDIETIRSSSLFKSLAPRHIRRYQEWLATKSPYVQKKGSYAPATLARKTTILNNFLKFLYESKYIEDPLHQGLLMASIKNEDRPNRDLGPAEVIQLLNHFRKEKHPIAFAIIHILTTTGLRNEEFCNLKVKDIQYDSINDGHFLQVLGKGNKSREVPLREKTLDSIHMFRYARGLEEIAAADKDSPLFTTNTGSAFSPSYLSQYLTNTIKQSQLPFLDGRSSLIGPHTLRHSFAIISYLSKVDIYQIMRSLGHEKIETTVIYLQKVMQREQHAIHSWDANIFGEYI